MGARFQLAERVVATPSSPGRWARARASETAGVLEQLGFKNVKVYDSSWLGYGNKLDAPAANETVFNVGALNGRIAAMQKRIDALEKELAATKK